MQAKKSQFVSGSLDSLLKHHTKGKILPRYKDETWEHLKWKEKRLEANISQRGTSEFNKPVPKEVLIL